MDTDALTTAFVFSVYLESTRTPLQHSSSAKSLEQWEPSDSKNDGGGWHEAADPAPARLIQMMFSGGQKKRAGAEGSREDTSASVAAHASVPRLSASALRACGAGRQGQLRGGDRVSSLESCTACCLQGNWGCSAAAKRRRLQLRHAFVTVAKYCVSPFTQGMHALEACTETRLGSCEKDRPISALHIGV